MHVLRPHSIERERKQKVSYRVTLAAVDSMTCCKAVASRPPTYRRPSSAFSLQFNRTKTMVGTFSLINTFMHRWITPSSRKGDFRKDISINYWCNLVGH